MAARIYIREIRPSDAQATEMTRIQLESFTGQSVRLVFFPKGRETEHEEFAFRKGQIVRGANDAQKHWVVAFSETTAPDGTAREEIIGYSLWIVPPVPGREKSDEEKAAHWEIEANSRPDSMDKEANDDVGARLGRVFREMLGEDPEDYWTLGALCVDPKHQRKGAATKMMRWGIEGAARQDKGVVLSSPPQARPFYLAMGFEPQGEVRVGDEMHSGMKIRPPRDRSIRLGPS